MNNSSFLPRPLITQRIRRRLWEVAFTSYALLRQPAATARHHQLGRICYSKRLEESTTWNVVYRWHRISVNVLIADAELSTDNRE